MLILRVIFLELLVCLHVVGAAALFRRFFPRESPWLGFVVPIVVVVAALNFVEHFVALPRLGWLLPLTSVGMLWTLARPRYSWVGLRFPTALFILSFTFLLLLKCVSPDIPDYTEGAVDLTRVLNYSLGEKVPPIDSWMPPYDSGGYYSFQQYGASLLKRLFSVDIGTALNLSFAMLLALLCQMGAAVAYSIRGKKWISVVTVLILLAGSSGSAPILMLLGHPDYGMSTDLDTSWDNPAKNPFSWILSRAPSHPGLTLVAPTYTIYCSEFHANLGATYLTMAILLASYEAFRPGRFLWPWICLATLPMVVLITSAWYFIIAALLGAGGLVLATAAGRRPENLKIAAIASAVGLVFVWPSFDSMAGNPFNQSFVWTPLDERIPLWMFLVQFWPVFIPWLLLFFLWRRLDWISRWIHALIPILFVGMEFVSLTERGFTSQKMWGDLYGLALITFLPLIFIQRHWLFRGVTILLTATFLYCLGTWMKVCYYVPMDTSEFAALRGDAGILHDNQRKRILQVLSSLHGATVLPGKSSWSYNLAPLVVTLSENRCFVAYTFQEEQYGHGGEIHYRDKLDNDFYSGAMTSPLPFLRSNNIAAVVIWPEDAIPDSILQQIQKEIGSEYFYVDCKMDEPNNAGVFMRQDGAMAEGGGTSSDPGATPQTAPY